LYEVVDGSYRLTHVPARVAPVEEWLGLQDRFAHLLRPENEAVVDRIQTQVEADWGELLDRCGDRIPIASG
jgi:pyruvate ferredoxin oxidoreductase beta subunit